MVAALTRFFVAYAGTSIVMVTLDLLWLGILAPPERALGWSGTLASAALFGFFAYATYDLTNLATLKDWPPGLSILDIAWGSEVSCIGAAAGKAVVDRLSAG